MSRVLRTALRTWPGDLRERDGAVLLATARQLIDDRASTTVREAQAIAVAGLQTRATRLAGELAGAPWREAGSLLLLPLAAVVFGALLASLVRGPGDLGVRAASLAAPGVGDVVLLAIAGTALVAAVGGRVRLVAVAAWLSLVAVLGRGFQLAVQGGRPTLQTWPNSIDLLPALVPALVLLALSASVARRHQSRSAANVAWRGAFATVVVGGSLFASVALAANPTPATIGIERGVSTDLPTELLLWPLPVAAFAYSLLDRRSPALRLATALWLLVPGPTFTWWALAATPLSTKDGLVGALLIICMAQLVWLGPLVHGVLAATRQAQGQLHQPSSR